PFVLLLVALSPVTRFLYGTTTRVPGPTRERPPSRRPGDCPGRRSLRWRGVCLGGPERGSRAGHHDAGRRHVDRPGVRPARGTDLPMAEVGVAFPGRRRQRRERPALVPVHAGSARQRARAVAHARHRGPNAPIGFVWVGRRVALAGLRPESAPGYP